MASRFTSYLLIMMIPLVFHLACKHELPAQPGNSPDPDTPSLSSQCSPDTVYFQQQVLPIFISTCALGGCHDAATKKEGLNYTSWTSIMATRTIRAFQPSESEAWKRITNNDPSDRMPPPPHSPLSQSQKDLVYQWILQGARNNACNSCDSSQFTYTLAIRPLISNYCQGCHSPAQAGGGYDLSAYAGVKARVQDGKLWGSVSHASGYAPMPKGGNKLSDCQLTILKKWIDAGAPNN